MVNYIVEKAIQSGDILPGTTRFIEATSGNTGIALAAAAARLNCPCTIIMPQNMSEQRKQMMKAFGATIIEKGDNDFTGCLELRDHILEEEKCSGKYSAWCPYQFSNPLNVECHFKTTAPEIHKQVIDLCEKWHGYVHGAGTGGTMMGVKQYIDHHSLNTRCILTAPAENAADHGIQGINDGADFLLNKDLMDDVVRIKTDQAIDRMKSFAKESGLLIGISSGANILAAEKYVQAYNPCGIIITMLCDRGERYL
jgi:cysteine synthase A